MRIIPRTFLVGWLSAALILSGAGLARADTDCGTCTNQEDGDNEGSAESEGGAASGDANAGQVTGVVSAGSTAVDAKNRSQDVSLESGAAEGSNSADAFVGLQDFSEGTGDQDQVLVDATATGLVHNQQEGDNEAILGRSADATSGDAVGGQIIGVVTSAGGSTDVVADNASRDVGVSTGDADADNDIAVFVGLNFSVLSSTVATDVSAESGADNQQEGDNGLVADQTATATSGDGVAGQVIGAVSAGDTSIDARNRSEDVDVETGIAAASQELATQVGLNAVLGDSIVATDATAAAAFNQQDGDNDADISQSADAASGDGVGGQVIGAVTSAGGSADIVADNASSEVDVLTGDASAANESASQVGLNYANDASVVQTDATVGIANNQQDGDNELALDQTAVAATGDGVAGQVVGAVSAGDTSIDARNRSENVDVVTGDAEAENEAATQVGLNFAENLSSTVTTDATAETVTNQQDGDNEAEVSQHADASSGDGVGGQVIGAVITAGGSADIVADNASKKVDVETGVAGADNANAAQVGLNRALSGTSVGGADVTVTVFVFNQQDGSNGLATDQTATATTGDGVAGQVVGAVSAGDTSIDAHNRSEEVDVETGTADADNEAASQVGQNFPVGTGGDTVVQADATAGAFVGNQQDGDNDAEVSQHADASSGDGVGGQVIGAVTTAGGSADIVADNASKKVDAETGGADADNEAASLVGQNAASDSTFVLADATVGGQADNQQDGDNSLGLDQTSVASSGDGVAGQVIGAVSAGDTSIDARNRSDEIELETGPAEADNDAATLVGLNVENNDTTVAADVTAAVVFDQQDGGNDADVSQVADASSGDGVGGQVIGAVTTAGGSADIVADNASKQVHAETGGADADNEAASLVGQNTPISGDSVVQADAFATSFSGNQQDGDNSLGLDQTSVASSGDGVGGQVIGAVSAGDTSIDARNRSEKVDVETGLAEADNDAASQVGLSLTFSGDTVVQADVTSDTGLNQQDGDNDASISQTADASSGDGVGGQVIGAVTSAGGSADIVADNASREVDVATGDADADNEGASLVGLNTSFNGGTSVTADAIAAFTTNQQDGDNSLGLTQTAEATTGDGVGGQVLGVVSAGDTSVDARNRSDDVVADTGDASAADESAVFVGLSYAFADTVVGTDAESDTATNQQHGDNDADISQVADASSGDGVVGQVIGAVTSAGGSADIVADNASRDVDVATGDADADSDSAAFVGLNFSQVGGIFVTTDVSAGTATNQQDGDNSLGLTQSADATSGDGVGGQVLGVVSAGDTSIDARNRSEGIALETGDASAANESAAFVGLNTADEDTVVGTDAEADTVNNQQEGDNDATLAQIAEASSGDAVAGQVAGVVTSAGGSADVVVDNASKDVEAETGPSEFDNTRALFVGLSFSELETFVGL